MRNMQHTVTSKILNRDIIGIQLYTIQINCMIFYMNYHEILYDARTYYIKIN